MSAAEKVWHRVRNMVGHRRTTAATSEAGNASTVQVRVNDMQLIDDVPVLTHFGFQSALPVGSDVVHLAIGGDGKNGVIVGSNHQPSRMANLPTGGARLHDVAGFQVLIANNGMIQISGPGELLHPLLTQLAAAVYNGHTHPANGAPPTQQMTALHWTTATRAGT